MRGGYSTPETLAHRNRCRIAQMPLYEGILSQFGVRVALLRSRHNHTSSLSLHFDHCMITGLRGFRNFVSNNMFRAHRLVIPYYCRLGDLQCFVFMSAYFMFDLSVYYLFLQYFLQYGVFTTGFFHNTMDT